MDSPTQFSCMCNYIGLERENCCFVLHQARKFLPYGFGPGAQTVILDVGSVDDDEEDYGDYQVSSSD